jgi:hypothetical protein
MENLLFISAAGTAAFAIGVLFFMIFEPWLRHQSHIPLESDNVPKVPAWITGGLERFVFGCAFAAGLEGAAAAMAIWLGLKIIPHWQQPSESSERAERILHHHRAFQSLLSGFVSLAIAAAVGEIFKGLLASYCEALTGRCH